MPFRALLVAVLLAAAPAGAAAQSLIRPESEPARVAGKEAWYRAGEPVMHRGESFYPGGAQVFFNPNVMVLAGEFRGVPVYVDPTLETNSIVYVPIGGGLMQPYEKLRAGELAGTTGSRAPSFPTTPASTLEPDVPVGTTGVIPPAPPLVEGPVPAVGSRRGTSLRPASTRAAAPGSFVTIAPNRAARGRGIWIDWNGQAWTPAGPTVRVGGQLVAIGTYNGRTVYGGPGGDNTIWIETSQGLATPWRR